MVSWQLVDYVAELELFILFCYFSSFVVVFITTTIYILLLCSLLSTNIEEYNYVETKKRNESKGNTFILLNHFFQFFTLLFVVNKVPCVLNPQLFHFALSLKINNINHLFSNSIFLYSLRRKRARSISYEIYA